MSPQIEKPDLALFSSITIHGVGHIPGINKDTPALTLKRSQSLPMRQLVNLPNFALPELSSLSLPVEGYRLEVELCENLSQGRTGMVFSVNCLSITSPAGVPETLPQIPESLCIKVAKPQFCRSMAREAWIYEVISRYDSALGVVTPQCFGMFAGRMQTPWCKVKEHDKRYASDDPKPGYSSSNSPSNSASLEPDWLEDDNKWSYPYTKDDSLKAQSPWNEWEPSKESDEITVLVLEKLGTCFPRYNMRRNSPEAYLLIPVRELAEDLAAMHLAHEDLRYCNVLEAQGSNALRVCPRHNKTHQWRIIDFDRAIVNTDSITSFQKDLIGMPFFWGWIID